MTGLGPLKGLVDLGSKNSSELAKSNFSDQDIKKMKEEAIQTEMKVNGLSREDAENKVEHLF